MKKDRASAEGEETWSRTAHGSRSMENTNWSPHTYTTRNENIPASFGLLSAIKRIPPVQPRINRVPGPRQTQIRFTSSLYADKFIETTSYRKSQRVSPKDLACHHLTRYILPIQIPDFERKIPAGCREIRAKHFSRICRNRGTVSRRIFLVTYLPVIFS